MYYQPPPSPREQQLRAELAQTKKRAGRNTKAAAAGGGVLGALVMLVGGVLTGGMSIARRAVWETVKVKAGWGQPAPSQIGVENHGEVDPYAAAMYATLTAQGFEGVGYTYDPETGQWSVEVPPDDKLAAADALEDAGFDLQSNPLQEALEDAQGLFGHGPQHVDPLDGAYSVDGFTDAADAGGGLFGGLFDVIGGG